MPRPVKTMYLARLEKLMRAEDQATYGLAMNEVNSVAEALKGKPIPKEQLGRLIIIQSQLQKVIQTPEHPQRDAILSEVRANIRRARADHAREEVETASRLQAEGAPREQWERKPQFL